MEDQNVLTIVEESETWLGDRGHQHCGTSVDLYLFSYHQTRICDDGQKPWNDGQIFHGNREEDLTFKEAIEHTRGISRGAVFLVHEPTKRQAIEDMIARSLRLKGIGILKAYGAGYNSQISKIVSSYRATTSTFANWLQAQARRPALNSTTITIPSAVQHVIRTGYWAIETIWAEGCTSDDLASIDSYHMIDDWVQIDPLCIRERVPGENDKMPVRQAFSNMILNHIYTIWEDGELLDLLDLLRNREARDARVILGAPVLLDPARRERMYHTYHMTKPVTKLKNWLQTNANPGSEWMVYASNEDPALQKIIEYQVKKTGIGFSLDFKGAMHFGSVVTSHYQKHFKGTGGDLENVDMKTRVDLVLKKVLPRLLSKRYNSVYAYRQVGANAAVQ